MKASKPLPPCTPVRILRHHLAGCTGTVALVDPLTGFYTIRLDRAGPAQSGPYVRSEIEPSPQPAMDARDGAGRRSSR